jgi:predicted CoA-binding protein
MVERGEDVLRSARTVLLIDWHPDVPRSLAAAGYDVYSVYQLAHRADLVRAAPAKLEKGEEVLEPLDPSDHRGVLVWHLVDNLPDQIDVVCTYRPPEEHLDLVERFALPRQARAFWVEEGGFGSGMTPPYRGPEQLLEVSEAAKARCEQSGIAVIEGLSIAAAARESRAPTS